MSCGKKSFRILHLAGDSEFIDDALKIFESVSPGCNDLYLYSRGEPKIVSTKPKQKLGLLSLLLGIKRKDVACYDFMVVHSVKPQWHRIIKRASRAIPVVWFGWGFDYYDIIFKTSDGGFLGKTKSHFGKKEKKIKRLKKILIKSVGPSKKSVIENIDYFSPVLPNEYDMVRDGANWKKFPAPVRWNYGALDEEILSRLSSVRDGGEDILVGNSATPSNNHLEAFDLLSESAVMGRKIICPLSYGDANYSSFVLSKGFKCFGDNFYPLENYMSKMQYFDFISKCGYVVMNHVRQQALGNIIVMIYAGAKVFLREENPAYHFFISSGAKVFSVQELELNQEMLCFPLCDADKINNRRIIDDIWSKNSSIKKTEDLIIKIAGE